MGNVDVYRIDINNIYYLDDKGNIVSLKNSGFSLYATEIDKPIYREYSTHKSLGVIDKNEIKKINILRDKDILLFVEKKGLKKIPNEKKELVGLTLDISNNISKMIDFVDEMYTKAKYNYEISNNKNKDFRI